MYKSYLVKEHYCKTARIKVYNVLSAVILFSRNVSIIFLFIWNPLSDWTSLCFITYNDTAQRSSLYSKYLYPGFLIEIIDQVSNSYWFELFHINKCWYLPKDKVQATPQSLSSNQRPIYRKNTYNLWGDEQQ